MLILFINIQPILLWQNTIFLFQMWDRAMVIMFLILMAPMAKFINLLPPCRNVKQGNYEPVIILVTPKKQQLINLGH